MVTRDIFLKLANGLDEFGYKCEKYANMGDILNYHGLKRMGEYYSLWTNYVDRRMDRFLIGLFGVFPMKETATMTDPTPSAFYDPVKAHRQKITIGERKAFAKMIVDNIYDGLEKLLALFQSAYTECMKSGEVASAMCIKKYIKKIAKEYKYLCRHVVEFDNVEYSPVYMEMVQKKIHDCYEKKTEKLEV